MTNKKSIFHKPEAEEIARGRSAILIKLEDILSVEINPKKEFLVIDGNIIPKRFFYTRKDMKGQKLTRTEANRKFIRHSPEIQFPRYRSVDEAVREMKGKRRVPVNIREEKFDSAEPGYYCAWSYIPTIGNDRRKRKVSLHEVLKGAKLYSFSCRSAPITVDLPSKFEPQRVAIDGGSVHVTVPSRTPKRQRYYFTIFGIPLVDNDYKYVLANSIISNHLCPDMMHRIRAKHINDKENSRVFNWDAHDIAAFFAAIDYYWNDRKNVIPLMMSQIPLPAQRLANYYDLFRYDTVILTKESKEQDKEKMYPLDNAEMEIALQFIVQKLKHNTTLFCDSRRDGNLRDYKWREM